MAKSLQLLILIFISATLQSQAQPFTSVSFSVQAHEDDWQLFMPSKIMADLNTSGRKVVFITLTAGDGSAGAAAYGPSSVPFYLTRENGSVYSSKYAADLSTGTATLDVPVATTVIVNTKSLTKYVYKNTVNYFFRLPDGNSDGSGFNNTGFQSLQRLRTGAIASMSALGPTAATYTWAQLTATIKQIITLEKVTGTQSWIHTAHTDGTYNAGDHSDHYYSGFASQDAVASGMGWVGINGFRDYNSSSFSANLSATEHENAAAIFALTNWGLVEQAYASNFNSGHKVWLPMDYFQVFKTPTGNAPFAGPGGGDLEIEQVKSSITEIPMIVSITSPVFIDKDISMIISPYEPGQLKTVVYDLAGNKVVDLNTTVETREALFVTLKQAIKTKGTYIIKNILNDKFIETRKIVVE